MGRRLLFGHRLELQKLGRVSILHILLPAFVTSEMTELFVPPIYLFRVLRNDENPEFGLYPKDPNAKKTIQSHVLCGSRKGYASQYISTCAEISQAYYWAIMDDDKSLTKRIAVIDTDVLRAMNIKMIDITNDNTYFTSKMAYNFANCYKEVLVEGFIPPEAIKQIILIALYNVLEVQNTKQPQNFTWNTSPSWNFWNFNLTPPEIQWSL